MSTVLQGQRALSACQKLPFCYLCGKVFDDTSPTNRDHVPPIAIFAERDRADPLILPTHEECNASQSIGDEIIAQLVGVLHGRAPSPRSRKLKVGKTYLPGATQPSGILHGVGDLRRLVWRCVKGFHAALYHIFLEVNGKANVHMPFPEGSREGNKVKLKPVLPQQESIATALKMGRIADTLDRVVCWNGKCVYECTWLQDDKGGWHCFFGLRLYDWETLADPKLPGRGCVGLYCPKGGKPDTASVKTTLDFPVAGGNPLDPFI